MGVPITYFSYSGAIGYDGSRGGALSRLRRARSNLAGETLDGGDSRTSGILPATTRALSAIDLR